MKRTGIFAAAAVGAMGATALVGGVGYTLAQEVAEQSGRPLDLGAVASVEPGHRDLAGSTAEDPAPDEEAPADGGDTGTDAGSPAGGGAAPVAPAPPVAIDPGERDAPPAHRRGPDDHADRADDAPHGHAPRDQGGTDDARRGGGDGRPGGGGPGGGPGGGGHGGGGHH